MILMKAVLSTGLGGEGQTNRMGAVGDVPRGPPEAHGGGGGHWQEPSQVPTGARDLGSRMRRVSWERGQQK